MTKLTAVYFGYIENHGHGLRTSNLPYWKRPDPKEIVPRFHWEYKHLDCGLLRNGNHQDIYDGKVFWTVSTEWYAFMWWDRSGDNRGASNSGLYLHGLETSADPAMVKAAWAAVQTFFPDVIKRQTVPLVLQVNDND